MLVGGVEVVGPAEVLGVGVEAAVVVEAKLEGVVDDGAGGAVEVGAVGDGPVGEGAVAIEDAAWLDSGDDELELSVVRGAFVVVSALP